MYKYIYCVWREREKKMNSLGRIFSVCALLPPWFQSISFSKMLHFIRDATFHLHWRSFREKVSLITESHTITHSFVFITNDTLLLQHASDVFIFFHHFFYFYCFEILSMAKSTSVESTIKIRRVKSSFHVHSTKAMCDDWKISTESS